jgi:hypothetical protein
MAGAPEWSVGVPVLQALSTFGMTGVIWLVQLVQYPGFARVGTDDFGGFHHHHCRSIGRVVGPLMVLELLTALLLAVAGEPVWFWRIMLGLLLVIWLSTAVWQGPLHGRLQREGPRPDLFRALVRGNWLRTVLWTTRSAGLVWFYARGWACS